MRSRGVAMILFKCIIWTALLFWGNIEDKYPLYYISEPRKPGAILNNISIFSADGLHLEWEKTDGFVNRYRVKIDDNEQETLDSKPHIDWNKLLLPGTLYNVTITAISYGFTTNYQTYGKRESAPASYWIMTVDCT